MFLPLQPPPAQIQNLSVLPPLPPVPDALAKAKDWVGLADWFEAVPPATRGAYYEWWLLGLKRSQRWDRLLTVCEALQPQVEAKTGPRLASYRLYRAQALGQLGRHAEAARAQAENGLLGDLDGLSNACAEARMAQDWTALLAYADEQLARKPEDAYALAWKGEALARMDHFAEAEPLLRGAVVKDPKIAYAWNNLGRCLNERKAWAEADEVLNQALALQPDNPVIAENLRQAERYAALPAPRSRR